MRREVRFVLHLWRDGAGVDAWRARLEELATRDVKHFASLAELTDHLIATATGAAERRPDIEEKT